VVAGVALDVIAAVRLQQQAAPVTT